MTSIFIKTPSLDDCQPRLKSASFACERKRLYPVSSQTGISCIKVVHKTWPSGTLSKMFEKEGRTKIVLLENTDLL